MCSEPILINDTNIREYVPDMPEEYFRIEYDAAKSDMIRYALLYHNGGISWDLAGGRHWEAALGSVGSGRKIGAGIGRDSTPDLDAH